MISSQYGNHVYFRRKQSLRAKQKNKEESGTQTGVNAVNTSLWLRKACAVRRVTNFLKNYLKDKNASQNQAGSEWFTWKNQYFMLHYHPLIIYEVILWFYLGNSSYRFAGYKQYTFRLYSYLEKGVRKVIPSCALWKIRNEYKADSDVYVPCMENNEDE